MTATQARRRPGRGSWIPWAFVAFFGVVFIANGILVWIAFASWTGLETASSYRHGLAYNRAIEAERAQAALDWTVDFEVAQTAPRAAALDLLMIDRFGGLIDDAAVRATFVRPTHEGFDRAVELPYHHDGHYVAEVDLPLAGVWDVRIEARAGGDVYRLRERIVLQP